jgi:aminopeptidase N
MITNFSVSTNKSSNRPQVLDCGSPLPLFNDCDSQSARGLAHSKTLSRVAGIFFALVLTCVQAFSAAADATRGEILKGALGPMRTCFDVTSYELAVRVDPTAKSLSGSNKITFKVVEDFNTMQVDLWSNLPISKIVFDNGAPATFTRELNAVFVTLPEQVKKQSTHSVTVHYGGIPSEARRPPWEGGISWSKDPDGNPWIVPTSSETGASIWWPNKEHASDEPDTMNISIIAPAGFDAICNGRLKGKTTLPDGWVRHDWHVSYPINLYNVTFNIAKYAHFSDEYVGKEGPPLTLDYYVLHGNLEKAREQFKQVKTMMDAFEKYFGVYPFQRDGYKLVECPHTGMEHQSCVAYGNNYLGGYRGRASSEVGLKFDFIIIHETAHEWWGNSVSDSDMADMWIHESFGAYAESLFVEHLYGYKEAVKYINAKKGSVRNDKPIIGEHGLFRRGSGDMYDKGQLVLNCLRSVIDDDAKWVSILRGLQETFRYKNINGDDVFNYINKQTGKDLGYFYDQYLKGTKIPTLSAQLVKDGDTVTLRYRWEGVNDNFRMPVKVTTTTPGKFEVITPTTQMQTMKVSIHPDDFKVADDLFYINTSIRRSYLDPRRPAGSTGGSGRTPL